MTRRAARLARLPALAGLLLLLLGTSAWAAPSSRIIGGSPASTGEYPAHGYLQFGGFVCGGTLIGNRYFLTAAHCATTKDTDTPLPASAFTVSLGKNDRTRFTSADRYSVSQNQVNTGYSHTTLDNDVALLTLTQPAPAQFEPLRLVGADETSLWDAGDVATIVGWGTTESGFLSQYLLEAQAPMRSDAYCGASGVWGAEFHPGTMVCAGDGRTDTCGGDSGGPLMVSDGSFLVLAGLTSWGSDPCADPVLPGVYTRLGAPALNAWVRERVPMARITSVSDPAPDPGEAVTFSATATHPDSPAYFTSYEWDFGDGTPHESGPEVTRTHTYATNGRRVVRVVATGAGADQATARTAVQAGPPDPEPTPSPTPSPEPTPTATVSPAPSATASPSPSPITTPPPVTISAGPLARLLAGSTVKVDRRGRFAVRVRFAAGTAGRTATVGAYRGARRIGVASVLATPGHSALVRIKLTKAGLAKLRAAKRLKITVRLRMGTARQPGRTLTLRR